MSIYLEEHLGRRIRTADLARWLGLDVASIRRNYTAFGGIRPVPGGKILFFERNVVDALRGGQHGIENTEERAYPMAGAGPETGPDQTEDLQHAGGSPGMGGERTRKRLGGDDRHCLFPAGLGREVP